MSRKPAPVLRSGLSVFNVAVFATLVFGTVVLGTAASMRAHAADVEGTLAQKNGWAAYQAGIDRSAAQVDAKCGGTLRAGYDKASYPRFDPIQDRTQAACQAAVGTLAALCITDAGKQSVRALSAARCRYSTTGTRVTREGGALTIHIDPERTAIVGAQAGSYSWASALREVL